MIPLSTEVGDLVKNDQTLTADIARMREALYQIP